ncbi:MAG: phosphatase PAP2 family protein [Planctomycetes bacterium]|nr:phosphatase PAP2 family protein [Planctomycetota bacterium]
MRRWDEAISRPLHSLRGGPWDYALALPGVMFGSYGMPGTVLALGLWLGAGFAVLVVAGALATVAVTGPLKVLLNRPRPEPLLERRVRLRSLVSNPAFPSGDSAQAAMVTTLLVLEGPFDDGRRWLFAPLVPLCMFSRVYYAAHWVGDTVAGAAIGIGVGVLYAHWLGALA